MLKKKTQVVMLPCNEKAKNCIVGFGNTHLLPFKPNYYYTQSYLNEKNITAFHLYFLSDEEIKEGDWKYNPKIGIWQHKREGKNLPDEIKNTQHPDTKKVIATTDKSLEPNKNWTNLEKLSDIYLPQPSILFIAKFTKLYNQGNPIQYVNVDYIPNWLPEMFEPGDYPEVPLKYNLKVDKNNEITITPIKDSWSREEVIN